MSPPWNKAPFLVAKYDLVKNSNWIAYGTITHSNSFHDRGADCSPSSIKVKVLLNKFVKGSYHEKEVETYSHKEGFYGREPIPLGKKMIVIGGKENIMAFEINDDSDTKYLQNLISSFTIKQKTSIFEVVKSVDETNAREFEKCYRLKKNKILKCLKNAGHPLIALPYLMWSEPNVKTIEKKYCKILLTSKDRYIEYLNNVCHKTLEQRKTCDYDNLVDKYPYNCTVIRD